MGRIAPQAFPIEMAPHHENDLAIIGASRDRIGVSGVVEAGLIDEFAVITLFRGLRGGKETKHVRLP